MTDKINKIFSSYLPAILISLLFIIPIINASDLFNGIVSAKKYGFYLLMTILIIYNIFLYIFDRNGKSISLNKIDFVFLLFIIWNFFSAFVAHESYINDKTIELIFLSIFYFIVKAHLIDTDNQKSFLIISIFFLLSIAITEVIIGILQLYHINPSNNPYFKVTGTFNNPTPYALLLTITYAYALAVYSFNVVSYKPIKYLALASCVLILSIVPFTLNRASWIGIAASTLLIAIFKLFRSKYILNLNKWEKIGLAALIVLLVGVSIPYLYNLKKGSSDGRLLLWKVSGNIIKEHPLIGIGYGRFHSEYNLYQADYFKGSHEKDEELLAGDVKLAFNDYIELLAETGIIGFILFISLIYYTLDSFKLKCDQVNLFLCPFVVFLILSLISYPGNKITTKILFFFFIAALSSFTMNSKNRTMLISPQRWLVVVLLFATLPFAVMQVTKFIKYKTFLYASKANNAKEYEISEVYFRQVYRTLKYESYFSLKYAESLFANKKYGEALDVLNHVKEIVPDPELYLLMGNTYIKQGENSNAKLCFEEAGYMVPGRILPKYYLTKLYYAIDEKSKADSLAEIILRMDIKINSDTTKALVNEIKAIYQSN